MSFDLRRPALPIEPAPAGRGPLRKSAAAATAGFIFSTMSGLSEIPRPVDAPAPRSAEESAASFRLPEGFHLEVVASEPVIASPSGACWTADGSLFVSELHGYNLAGQLDIEALNKSGRLDTQVRRVQAAEEFKKAAEPGTFGVVKRLLDTDGDGRMDRADTWTTDLPPVYGLVPARDGVIAACAPHIVFLADRDGDGRAETKEILFTGFGTGELERGINAPQWGVDGWIYFSRGWTGGPITGPRLPAPVEIHGSNFRIRADGSAIEPVTGHSHTFGLAIHESGDHITVSTTTSFSVAPLPWRSLVRNQEAAVADLQTPIGDRRAYAISQPHPWRQKRADDPAYFEYYKSRYGAAESEAGGWFTAACGPLVYQDRALPGLHGQYFVCEPSGNLIHRELVVPAGPDLTLKRVEGEETSEFAASTDPWSHPIHLLHGPDGAIWIVDYYREIIEDYSAIPRHLQQQYGVYRGHERGRLHRLTHRDLPPPPPADMSRLDAPALARECSSPYLWRRLTAQRLLVEGRVSAAVPALRALLNDAQITPSALITALRTLEQLGAAGPHDVIPLLTHPASSVRIHSLQVSEHWLPDSENTLLLDAVLAAAAGERDARVLIQCALSLGESRDPRAFALLVRFSREHLGIRWMDAALLSSLSGRGVEMLAALLHEPGAATGFLVPLAHTIGARGEEEGLARTLAALADQPPERQAKILAALARGRNNVLRRPLTDPAAIRALSVLAASPAAEVRSAVRAFEDTFTLDTAALPAGLSAEIAPPIMEVSDETFRGFVAALAGPRDTARGAEIFRHACAACHRVGQDGHDVGPDLMGEVGVAEESLVRHLLLPSERIRPGFETVLVETHGGATLAGLLKHDGATSLTLVTPGGNEQVLLRRDVARVRRLPVSLMPSFAALPPSDVAGLLSWLRSQSHEDPSIRRVLFDEDPAFAALLTDQSGTARVVQDRASSGRFCLHITPPQRASARIPEWQFHIVENPSKPDEFRYLRLSWRAAGAGAMIELAANGRWPDAGDPAGRYFAGRNTTPWKARAVSDRAPREWETITLDLWKDIGGFTLTGLAPTALEGEAWFDRIELLRRPPGKR